MLLLNTIIMRPRVVPHSALNLSSAEVETEETMRTNEPGVSTTCAARFREVWRRVIVGGI
jgi:hypothetical protein